MEKKVCIFCGARRGNDPTLIEEVKRLSQQLAANNIALVYGGGAVGLMGVAADAALAAGGEVIGVIPGFLDKKEILHPGISETIRVDDLFQRKAKMIEASDAFITLPGGMGTFDELLEVLTWKQLGQLDKPIALFNYENYFASLHNTLSSAATAGFYDMSYLDEVIIEEDAVTLVSRLLAEI